VIKRFSQKSLIFEIPKIEWEIYFSLHTTHLLFTEFSLETLYKVCVSVLFSLSSFSSFYIQKMTGINGISFKDSKDDAAKIAIERIEQIKGQLNLSSSPMSRQAPKDIEAERAKAEFNIQELKHLFYGGAERYKVVERAQEFIKNDPLLVAQPPRNFVEFNKDEMREL
jgi:hypothetical protein